ncbi:MAG: anaerobic ribonucleoside-triphosphate reductase activating protein [Oscillospiraceae bacterium]|nr:anaerobic ribonucleoside-triphosphate reductase activating protein [Oscillospiraceae bacterium]
MEIRIAGTVQDSIVDGPGLRYVVFTQGCPHRCEGCHNPETHDFSGGKLTDTDRLYEECTENPLTKGVTFSGGEPFCQAEALYELGCRLKERGYHLMSYSGWTFEELQKKAENEEYVGKLLSILDILVDGRFELANRSLMLTYRGSTNQRLIDVQKSLAENRVTEVEI